MSKVQGEPSPKNGRNRPAVLVVEDEVLIRMMVADAIRSVGYTVIEAANAYEAADVLNSRKVEVGLVFSDIRMPGAIDGFALAKLIRANHPSVKIVLTSGHLEEDGGADHDAFFRKPYAVAGVIRRIKSLLDKEQASALTS